MLNLDTIVVILNIFKLNYIHYGVFYQCDTNHFSTIQKMFINKQISLSVINIQQINTMSAFRLGSSKFGLILDTDCEDWAKVFSNNATYKASNKWIVVSSNLTNTVSILSYHPIEIDSDVNILVRNRNYDLYEVFNTGYLTKGKVIVNHIGYFDSELHTTSKPRIGINMKGVILKCPIVVTDSVVDETFLHFVDRWRPPARDPVHKFKYYKVLTYLQAMFGFEYDFVRTKSWGYLRNGSFDGMVGELQRRRADVGGSGVFFRTDRAQHVQYAVNVWKVRPCFIFRHPKYPGGWTSLFTRPLSPAVWGGLAALLLAAAMLLAVMLRATAFEDTSLSLVLVFVSSAVGQQGIPIYSESSSIKIVIFSTLIFTLTLYQYFNATVVSTLLREPPTTIRTLEDLLHSKMEIGIEDTLYDRDYFRRTTDPVALKLYHTKIVTAKKRNLFPAEEGMRLVKAGGFAFHLESVAGYRIMRASFAEREICEAQEIQLYPPQQVAVVLKKDSPYREFFAVGMHEAGVMGRLNGVWEESRPACVRTPDAGLISVSLADFAMALVVLGVGVALAALTLVGELVAFRVRRRYL